MNQLQAGFARLDITPPMGVRMAGYFFERLSEGVLDPLYVNALALKDGDYFPTTEAFKKDGYEPRGCRFAKGVGERLADAASQLLQNL